MGFCRRCGDIVAAAVCKCGGTAAAPVVSWSQLNSEKQAQDRWSKTYVQTARSGSPTRPSDVAQDGAATQTPMKRFPRPRGNTVASTYNLSSHVSAHIASSTSQPPRSSSPLKYSNSPAPECGILPSLDPNDKALSKVYGSVLQPKETLQTHSCAICSIPFPPDSTIYPDPLTSNKSRFLCRGCFITNGGSKGDCPQCNRPVLILKSEGGFVHVGDRFWHKRCFNCSGCQRNIGDSPMVDLLGRPSCINCFDTCLKRDPTTPKKGSSSKTSDHSPETDNRDNIGGISSRSAGRSREASPAIRELEDRLGITKSRESSPTLEELNHRLSLIGRDSGARTSTSGKSPSLASPSTRSCGPGHERSPLTERYRAHGSNDAFDSQFKSPGEFPSGTARRNSVTPIKPLGQQQTGSPTPTREAIEEMKQRFLKGSSSPSPLNHPTPPLNLRTRRTSVSVMFALDPTEMDAMSQSSVPPTPDLMSDFSDTQSSTSYMESSPRLGDELDDPFQTDTPKKEHVISMSPINCDSVSVTGADREVHVLDAVPPPPQSKRLRNHSSASNLSSLSLSAEACARCGIKLFAVGKNGHFVTVVGDNGESTYYHADCFHCAICRKPFKERVNGEAIYVKATEGPCHIECAPITKVVVQKASAQSICHSSPPDKELRALPAPNTISISSRFDRSPFTPAMQPLNTPSPRFGSKTLCPGCHMSVSPMERGVVPGPQGTRWHAGCLVCGGKKPGERAKDREEKKGAPGCGKKLDSAAKLDAEGNVWCRECLLAIGGGAANISVLLNSNKFESVAPQLTGTTTIARQFTGLGSESGILRHMTGGGMSPTRSISPTKQLTGTGSASRPRPKSVIGMRGTKSIDEGRGMFLVRQMTGTTTPAWKY